MKKIVISAAAMGGAALIAWGGIGTFAAFTSEAQVANQSAGAGTFTVAADRVATSDEVSAGNNLKPGDHVDLKYYVANDQSSAAAGTITGKLIDFVDNENQCVAAEQAIVDGSPVDSACDWNQGDFSDAATVIGSMTANITQDKCVFNDKAQAPLGTLKQVSTKGFSVPGDVQPGSGDCFVLRVTLPSTATNKVQSDFSQFKVQFTLTQK